MTEGPLGGPRPFADCHPGVKYNHSGGDYPTSEEELLEDMAEVLGVGIDSFKIRKMRGGIHELEGSPMNRRKGAEIELTFLSSAEFVPIADALEEYIVERDGIEGAKFIAK